MNDASGGHTHCANCGAPLDDRYCGRCGQDSHVSLSFGHFLHEFVEGMFHVDSSFWRTLRALVTRPGLLTEQYLGGKRRMYSPPFRGYLVISIAYFVVASIFAPPASHVLSPSGSQLQASDCARIAANPGWLLSFVPDLEGMLFTYYEARGWDLETGKPSREKLSELGLEDVAMDLWG